jgi:predicted nucleic acid-binding protein
MKLYIDANVYLDLLLTRKERYKDHAATAAHILFRARQCEFFIAVSDHVVDEIERGVPRKLSPHMQQLFSSLRPKLVSTEKTPEDIALSRSRATHLADALHIILAERLCCSAIVTRNVKDFVGRTSLPVLLPEEV